MNSLLTRPLALGLLLLGSATAASAPSFYIFWRATSDQQKKYEGSLNYGEAAADALSNFVAQALADKYACSKVNTQDDIEALLGHERLRQLLGGPENSESMQSVAGTLGAAYLVSVNVTAQNGVLTASVTTFNGKTGLAVAKNTARMPADENALYKLENLANQAANSLGASGPNCLGPWHGTVTVKEDYLEKTTRYGAPYERHESQEATCAVEKEGGNVAKCRASISRITTEKCASGVDCSGSVIGSGDTATNIVMELKNAKIVLQIGSISIAAKVSSAGMGTFPDPQRVSLGDWKVEAETTGNPKSESGSKTLTLLKNDTITSTVTIDWVLTR